MTEFKTIKKKICRKVACVMCGDEYWANDWDYRQRGARYCSKTCANRAPRERRDMRGPNNPRWLGGLSSDNMRYRKRQKNKFPEKELARATLRIAVRSGRLHRKPCEHCGANVKTHGHHDDYSKPLDVVWLCRPCHVALHNKLRTAQTVAVPSCQGR